MACRPNGITKVYQRIPVTVWKDPCDLDEVSRGLALAPSIPPRAAVEGCKPAQVCLWTRPALLNLIVLTCRLPWLLCESFQQSSPRL